MSEQINVDFITHLKESARHLLNAAEALKSFNDCCNKYKVVSTARLNSALNDNPPPAMPSVPLDYLTKPCRNPFKVSDEKSAQSSQHVDTLDLAHHLLSGSKILEITSNGDIQPRVTSLMRSFQFAESRFDRVNDLVVTRLGNSPKNAKTRYHLIAVDVNSLRLEDLVEYDTKAKYDIIIVKSKIISHVSSWDYILKSRCSVFFVDDQYNVRTKVTMGG